VAAQAAAGPSHALGDDADLAVVERVEGQDLVGLAEVAALEDDGLGSVDPRLAHMFGIVVAWSAATQRERERVVKEPAALRAGVPAGVPLLERGAKVAQPHVAPQPA